MSTATTDIDLEPPDEAELKAAKAVMDGAAAALDSTQDASGSIVRYVEATLTYGVTLTRAEYRWLAARNWREIRRWAKRNFALLVCLALVLIGLGLVTVNTTDSLTTARNERLQQQCELGTHAIVKVHEDITKAPVRTPAQRAKLHAEELATVELIDTLAPLSDCSGRRRRERLAAEPHAQAQSQGTLRR